MFSALRFLDHGGEMAQRIRAHDWSGNPIGPPEAWPQPLRFALGVCLGSSFPTAIYWGPELRLLYNDAWAPIPAERHPWCLGRPAAEVWGDIWDVIAPQFARVVETGEGFAAYDQLLHMERGGVPQETYWNYSFTPIRDEWGVVVGVLNQGNETTRTVLGERDRRMQIERLRELFQQAPAATAVLRGPDHVFELVNAAYIDLIGGRDPVGLPLREALPEVVDQGFVALLDEVRATGEAFRGDAVPVSLRRNPEQPPETRVLDFVYQPTRDSSGTVDGIFVQVADVTDRATAEAALRDSEERLQLALDASTGIGTWEWNAQSGRIAGDARFAKLFGVAPEVALAGTTVDGFLALVHPDDRAALAAALAEVRGGQPDFRMEYRIVRPDGGVRWLMTQGRCSYDMEGAPVRFPGVSFDITERRHAEEAARATADELRVVSETQSFLYALAERQRTLDTPDAIMRFTSAALARRLDVDRVGFYRVVGENMIRFGPGWASGALPPLEGSMTIDPLAVFAEAYRAGRTIAFADSASEFPGTDIARTSPSGVGVPLLRGGHWVASLYVNGAGARSWTGEEIAFIEAVAESAWDAVERLDAMAALRESEAKFRGIVNSIDQMIWSTRPDGYHDYFNDRWYEYTGVPYGSTDGDAWNGVFHPEDQTRAQAIWAHSLATGEPYRIEYRLRHVSGAYRWVLGRAQPVYDDDGAITRWFGTCTDIQEIVDAREVLARSRVELEAAVEERTRQLMAAEEQLRQAQKMEAVGQLTGGIAHDFNNMLAVVIGALDLLERRLAQGDKNIDRYLVAARDGATRAAALTQRLLAFARQQPLAPVAVDANAMVRGMIELLVRTLGEEVTVETRLPGALWAAKADPHQLENVVLNLSVNARDAMQGGGTLTIATANVAIEPGQAAEWEVAPGDYVEIAVTDTGSGMPPEVAARAFEPFFTTKSVGKGTGLGLSQVFGFVRQSGGHVRIDTAPGVGTTVRVYLPRHADVPTPAEPGPAERHPAPRALPGEVVLIVEDEERVRSYSCEALRELGYTVIDARDGLEALRILEHGQAVSLLFTDVVMPELTGRELAERARRLLPELRVLFTSGYTREAVADATLDANLLAKPFDLETLARRVRAALDE